MVGPDGKRNDYGFTDGCGTSGRGLAIEIAKRISIPVTGEVTRLSIHNDVRLRFSVIIEIDVPSAFQVRIAGCKGMLMVDPGSKRSDHYIKVRASMKKFDSDDWTLYIVDHSRPSKATDQL